MSIDAAVPDPVVTQLRAMGPCDIVVGIPTLDSETTVAGVVEAVEAGLRSSFPDRRAAIVISDGGSSDGTLAAALGVGAGGTGGDADARAGHPTRVGFRYLGLSGKGSAFRAIFECAAALNAGACATVDSDLRSIEPFWIDNLLRPVLDDGFDHIAPVYVRHRFDGTITNSLAYPLTTSLYGTRIRQPIGGDFGFSGRLAAHWAARNVWHTDVARFGIDVWMTTIAVVEGFRVGQANLGVKIHDPKDPGADLAPMFRQVVGSLFALAGKYHDRWSGDTTITDPPTFGTAAVSSSEPIAVSRDRLVGKFVEGANRHGELWGEVLEHDTANRVVDAVRRAERSDPSLVPADLWFRAVYEFLVAYCARDVDPATLLGSLVPLYFARTATFVSEVESLSDAEAEAAINAFVEEAFRLKPYLLRRWRDRGVPDRLLADQPVPPEERVEDSVH
jgi:hypothetical protein